MEEPKIPLSKVFKLFKRFMIEEIHDSDFVQGQDIKDTMSVLKKMAERKGTKIKKKYK